MIEAGLTISFRCTDCLFVFSPLPYRFCTDLQCIQCRKLECFVVLHAFARAPVHSQIANSLSSLHQTWMHTIRQTLSGMTAYSQSMLGSGEVVLCGFYLRSCVMWILSVKQLLLRTLLLICNHWRKWVIPLISFEMDPCLAAGWA